MAWKAFHLPPAGVQASASVQAANTAAITQPGNPVDVNGTPVNEPRATIIAASASYSFANLRLTMTPGQYTNPNTDANWRNQNTFFLFTFGTRGASSFTGSGRSSPMGPRT